MASRRSPAPGAARAIPGDTPIAKDFFAGRYAKVIAATFDDPAAEIRDEDTAFVVGALTFVGRIDDAEGCFEEWRARGGRDARTVAASRFFVGVARARAGDFDRSHELLVARAHARAKAPDPWALAFVFQGLACHRYFTGRYRAAARHALRALRAAIGAKLPYAQMLSTDLRGHALVQIGKLQAGLALLERAKGYAERLGLELNAYAIACSMVVYRASFKVGPEALRDLEAQIAERSHDSYSRRSLLTQAAIAYAIRGRGTDAERALDEASRDALRMDARRAKATTLIARLHVTRWRYGAHACAALLDDAASLLAEGEVGLRAELFAFEALVGRAIGDADRAARALAALRDLAARAEHRAPRAALDLFEGDGPRAFAEDELTPLLRAAAQHDERALPRALALGLLGVVPEIAGLVPGRRVLLVPAEDAVILEDRGDLQLRSGVPRWVPPLLSLLAGGASKEAIVAKLWGLRRYRPERHDPLVRTAIHRLRSVIEPRGAWVTVTANGYGLAAAVVAIGASDPIDALPEDEPIDDTSLRAIPMIADDTSAVDARVLDGIVRAGEARVPDLCRALRISESTALRAIRRLVRDKRVTRIGAARATRYRARG